MILSGSQVGNVETMGFLQNAGDSGYILDHSKRFLYNPLTENGTM